MYLCPRGQNGATRLPHLQSCVGIMYWQVNFRPTDYIHRTADDSHGSLPNMTIYCHEDAGVIMVHLPVELGA